MEYTIVLGVVSAVLIGMNVYIKRGIQGRLRDMSDFFISQEHVVSISPVVDQATDTITDSTLDTDGFRGGSSRAELATTTNIVSHSEIEDQDAFYLPAFNPADGGYGPPPIRPED